MDNKMTPQEIEVFNSFVRRLWNANHSDTIAVILTEYATSLQKVDVEKLQKELELNKNTLDSALDRLSESDKRIAELEAANKELTDAAGNLLNQMTAGEKRLLFHEVYELVKLITNRL